MSERQELSGWGQIAGLLGVTERTALTYERKLGLPVHHMPGVRGRVWAFSDEIEAWKLSHREIPAEHGRHRLWATLAVGLLTAAGLGAWMLTTQRGEPAIYRLSGNVLTVFDSQSRVVWRHEFTAPPALSEFWPNVLFSDFDDDGKIETLFNYSLGNGPADAHPPANAVLYLFDDRGQVKWSAPFGTPISSRTGEDYSQGQYTINLLDRLHAPRPDGGLIVAGGGTHSPWTYEIAIYTAGGRKVDAYLHPGWLSSIAIADLNGDGVDEIILGGMNSGYWEQGYGATLAVLDSRRIAGQGSVPPRTGSPAANLPTGQEAAVILFRDFAPTRTLSLACRITSIEAGDNYLQARARQDDGTRTQVDYRLDGHLRLVSVLPDSPLAEKLLAGLRKPIDAATRHRELMRRLGDIKVLRNEFAAGEGRTTEHGPR